MKVKKLIEILNNHEQDEEIIAFWWVQNDLHGTENLNKKDWEEVVYRVDEADWYEMNHVVQHEVNFAIARYRIAMEDINNEQG
jgi:hypothetical protein